MPIGQDLHGEVCRLDLAAASQTLVVGAAGSGRSTALNGVLTSLLRVHGPETLMLVLIDSDRLRLTRFADLPHLAYPVATTPEDSSAYLAAVVNIMERRYRLMARLGARAYAEANARLVEEGLDPLPYLLVVVDELVAPMASSTNLAQIGGRGRGCGVHVLLATESPLGDVLPAAASESAPTRVVFRVTTSASTTVALAYGRARSLAGAGDGLLELVGAEPVSFQGAYVSVEQVSEACERWTTPVPVLLTPLATPADWPSRPGVEVTIQLANPRPVPAAPYEHDFAAGLTALAAGEPRIALERLRVLTGGPQTGAYPAVQILVLLLSCQLGDAASTSALLKTVPRGSKPDPFAARAIESCTLSLFVTAGDHAAAVSLPDALRQRDFAIHLAQAGRFLGLGRAGEAAFELETAQPLANEDMLRALDQALSQVYEQMHEWDRLLDLAKRSSHAGAALWKAQALEAKGLIDAALVVYDDAIRDGKQRAIYLEYHARYRKARLLVATGDISRARRELARLYADNPDFDDYASLLNTLHTSKGRTGREPIPEEVRHAVWRRDEGQCVQCGSREKLEYDHVIPVSRGGANTERNLQLLCEPCNRRKSASI